MRALARATGLESSDIAAALDASETAVSRWLAAARRDGPAALRSHPTPGPVAKVTPEQLELIPDFLWHGPEPTAFGETSGPVSVLPGSFTRSPASRTARAKYRACSSTGNDPAGPDHPGDPAGRRSHRAVAGRIVASSEGGRVGEDGRGGIGGGGGSGGGKSEVGGTEVRGEKGGRGGGGRGGGEEGGRGDRRREGGGGGGGGEGREGGVCREGGGGGRGGGDWREGEGPPRTPGPRIRGRVGLLPPAGGGQDLRPAGRDASRGRVADARSSVGYGRCDARRKVYSLVRPHFLNGLHSIAFLAHLVRQVAGRILVSCVDRRRTIGSSPSVPVCRGRGGRFLSSRCI